MYAKIFSQIYSSSIAEDYLLRLVFMDMLVLADQHGVVDMTREAIARFTNVPLDLVSRSIVILEGDDPKSRNPKANGARIVRLDDHRNWGWIIVNYDHYRSLANEEQRREKTRERVRKFREKTDETPELIGGCDCVTPSNAGNAMQKHMQKQKQKEKTGSTALTDDEWLAELGKDDVYAGIDVNREYGKMKRWASANNKQPSRKRFINWLNRIDCPAVTTGSRKQMVDPLALRIGKIFRRRSDEQWEPNEVSLFGSISPTLKSEDIEHVERLYNSDEPMKFRSLEKLLANWKHTLDRARIFKPTKSLNL